MNDHGSVAEIAIGGGALVAVVGNLFKLTAGTAGVFGLLVLSRRSGIGQRSAIRRHLRRRASGFRRAHAAAATSSARHPQVDSLRASLIACPHAPIIVAGPESCGASQLVRQALCETSADRVLWYDLEERAGSTFWEGLIAASGFNMMPRIYSDLKLSSQSAAQVDAIEVQQMMSRTLEVLAEPGPPPVVVVDQLRRFGADDEMMHRFLDFALHLTDSGAAHVVVVTRTPVALRLDRERRGFAAKRQLLLLDYLPQDMVQAHLEAQGVEKSAAAESVSIVGGQFKDLNRVVVSETTEGGGGWRHTCGELLADASREFEEHWELQMQRVGALSARSGGTNAKIAVLKEATRFWETVCLLAASPTGEVDRGKLVASVYVQFGSELDSLVEDGLLTLALRRPTHTDTTAAHHEVLVKPASPKLHRAMKSAVEDVRYLAQVERVAEELRKAESTKRMKQLSLRRREQAAALSAFALDADLRLRLPDGARQSLEAKRTTDGGALARLAEELCETGAELRTVRSEYDSLKWKQRWSETAA